MTTYTVFTSLPTNITSDIAYLECSEGHYEFGLNRPGKATFTVAKTSPIGLLGWQQLEPLARAIWVQRESEVVWGGLVWDVSSSSGDVDCTINAEEFPSLAPHIRLSQDLVTNSFTLDLIGTILALQPAPSQVMDMVRSGSTTGAAYFPFWYEYENRMLDDIVAELSRVGMHTVTSGALPSASTEGFEWTQEISHNSTLGYLRPKWTFWCPRAGSNRTLEGHSIEWGVGTRENCRKVSWSKTGRHMVNRMKVVGYSVGSPSTAQRYTEGSAVGGPYPQMDGVVNNPDLKFNSQVQALARDLVPRLRWPLFNMRAEFDLNQLEYTFGKWKVGDRLWCTVNDAGFYLQDTLRIVGLSYNWQGSWETVTLDLQPDLPTAIS